MDKNVFIDIFGGVREVGNYFLLLKSTVVEFYEINNIYTPVMGVIIFRHDVSAVVSFLCSLR